MLVAFYNGLKTFWSAVNNLVMGGAPRHPVPKFDSPEAAAKYLMAHVVYTGDGPGGVMDFYLHPERLQAAMENGKEAVERLMVDCDDYATWAYAALRQMVGVRPTIYTLIDSGMKFNHCICVYTEDTPHGRLYGAIDTNGQRPLANIEPSTICKVWTGLYGSQGANYIEADETPYPF
jgi:hypothetical protein